MTEGKKITWKKGKQYNLPYNIKAAGKNIKCMGKSGRGRQFWGRKSRFKTIGGGEEYSFMELYTPLLKAEAVLSLVISGVSCLMGVDCIPSRRLRDSPAFSLSQFSSPNLSLSSSICRTASGRPLSKGV